MIDNIILSILYFHNDYLYLLTIIKSIFTRTNEYFIKDNILRFNILFNKTH
jgi:hypothetical protein